MTTVVSHDLTVDQERSPSANAGSVRTPLPIVSNRGPARSRLRERAHRGGVAHPRSPRRAQSRRHRASRRQRLPAGDRAGADARRRQAGHRRDHGCRQRDECPPRQGARRRSRKTRRSICSGATARLPRPPSGRSATKSSIGPRRCRSTPMRRSRASSCSRITPFGTAITTSRGSEPRSRRLSPRQRPAYHGVCDEVMSCDTAILAELLVRSRRGSRRCGRPATLR